MGNPAKQLSGKFCLVTWPTGCSFGYCFVNFILTAQIFPSGGAVLEIGRFGGRVRQARVRACPIWCAGHMCLPYMMSWTHVPVLYGVLDTRACLLWCARHTYLPYMVYWTHVPALCGVLDTRACFTAVLDTPSRVQDTLSHVLDTPCPLVAVWQTCAARSVT